MPHVAKSYERRGKATSELIRTATKSSSNKREREREREREATLEWRERESREEVTEASPIK